MVSDKNDRKDALNRLVMEVNESEAKYVLAVFVDAARAFENL